MDPVQVDVVGLQPAQARLDRGDDLLAVVAGAVRINRVGLVGELGGEHEPVAAPFEQLAEDGFRRPVVMGADPGIPPVLTGLTGVTRLCRCTRGVPVLSAFAADTGVQVGQPGVGREANALASSLARANDAIRKRPSMALRRAATARPGSGVRSIYGGRISG